MCVCNLVTAGNNGWSQPCDGIKPPPTIPPSAPGTIPSPPSPPILPFACYEAIYVNMGTLTNVCERGGAEITAGECNSDEARAAVTYFGNYGFKGSGAYGSSIDPTTGQEWAVPGG